MNNEQGVEKKIYNCFIVCGSWLFSKDVSFKVY